MISRLPLLGTLLLVGTLATGCASTGAIPHPFPTPAPRARTETPVPASPVAEPEAPITAAAEPESDLAKAPANPNPDSRIPNSESPIPNRSRIDGYIIAGTALQLRGTPYRLGGADPENGFDCSGLVQYVFGYYGISVPRDVRSQYRAVHRIGDKDIQPGDLLFFATDGDEVSHVAIAISSNQFVHSPNSRGVVRVETLRSDYWNPRYVGAARVVFISNDLDVEVGGSPAAPSSRPPSPEPQIPDP